MNPAPLLAADGVHLSLGGRNILTGAYVDAIAGFVTALVGRVGAGKTTLLKVCVGRARGDVGQIRWEGERVARPSLARLARRGLCYVPAEPWIPGRLTVQVVLALARGVHTEVGDIAAELGLGSLLSAPVAQLSNGERRLVEIAFGVLRRPRVLVVDEPFAGLEPLNRERVGRLLTRLAADGAAVLFADHDPRLVRDTATRLFSIEAGTTRLVPDFRELPLHDWYHAWPGSS